MTIELIDQMVRREGGGEMHRALVEADSNRRQFVIGRIGLEAESVFASMESNDPGQLSFAKVAHYARRAREELTGVMVSLMLALRAGRPSRRGYSAAQDRSISGCTTDYRSEAFLKKSGFIEVRICQADESRIGQFSSFNLDTLTDVSGNQTLCLWKL